MRLILIDIFESRRRNFHPLAHSHGVFELRCGITTLAQKLIAKVRPTDVAAFVPEYLSAVCRERLDWPVNNLSTLAGDDDLLVVDATVKAQTFNIAPIGPGEVCVDEAGQVLYARIPAGDARKLAAHATSVEGFLTAAAAALPKLNCRLITWQYIWDLVLANPSQIAEDFAALGHIGVKGTVEQPSAVRGLKTDVYIAPEAVIQAMAVIDATNGPVYIDEGAQVHPFTRIEGPCYVGPGSVLLGAKCREGNSIGPHCRVGGEVEESIIQGYSNKYHDGFLGHAFVGEWVNLGALTTNSDLRNDYGPVAVRLDERGYIDTGSTKVGVLIGDHAKTSIGTLFNTGTAVGAMSLLVAGPGLLPKSIPSFCSYMHGQLGEYFGRETLYETARRAMPRRGKQFTDAQRAMWDAVYAQTADLRRQAAERKR